MKGSDLKCDCGAGAVDVAPDYEIGPRVAISWRCANGHRLIYGWRELDRGKGGATQMNFGADATTAPKPPTSP